MGKLKTIGSSQVAGILGLSPWTTPHGAWASIHGFTSFSGNAATKRGHILENAIAEHYAAEHCVYLRHGPRYDQTPVVGAEPWMTCRHDRAANREVGRPNPWGFIEGDHLVECKSTRHFGDEWGWPGTDEAPAHYLCQVVWQMAVIGHHLPGLDKTVIVAFSTTSDEFREYVIHRDERTEDALVSQVADWYERHVLGTEPVPVDGSDAAREALLRRFRRPRGTIRPANAQARAWGAELRQVRTLVASLSLQQTLLENRLKELIGDDRGIEGVATWTPRKGSRRLDRAALERDHPELARKYIKEGSPSRTFKLTQEKP